MSNINFGMAVVIVAVLVFYLRLIIIQRERAKRLQRTTQAEKSTKTNKSRKTSKPSNPAIQPNYSIISQKRLDRWIGFGGLILIVIGLLMNIGLITAMGLNPQIESFWWIPTSVGIIVFSWAFRL